MEKQERYQRQVQLAGFGITAQQKLANAKLLVVGAGGLGIPALQYLAGMGISTLGIVDGDTINLSNLNRQVLYTELEIGQSKVDVLKQKLLLQNPGITVLSFNTYLTVDNALEIINDFDIVIDATDNFAARYLINDACVILGKPFVYGAIHQFEGQLSVFNFQDGPTYRCLYPQAPSVNEIPNCNTAGVLGVVPGLIGCSQALEAVKVITGVGEVLSGQLLVFDFLNNEQYKMKLKVVAQHKKITALGASYSNATCAGVNAIKPDELNRWIEENKNFQLLDVREAEEFKGAHFEKSFSLPLGKIKIDTLPIDSNFPVVTICPLYDFVLFR